MPDKFVFLSVDDPELFKQGKNKSLVQSHVGKFNRRKAKAPGSTEKGERLGKLVALRARKIERDRIAESNFNDERFSTTGCQDPASSTEQEPSKALKHPDMQECPPPMTEIITILPVSQQMDYGSSPTRSSQTGTTASDDLGDDEACDQRYLTDIWMNFVISSPVQGRLDPFAKWPVATDDSNQQISRLVHHAISRFWSQITPQEQSGIDNPINHVYLDHMRHSILAFYCYTIAISHNYDFLSNLSPSDKRYGALRAKHLHVATRMVRKQIQEMPANPSPEQIPDELIGSVIALAANYRVTVYNREDWPKSKFQSPLATLQCLDMWGLLPLLPPHRLAVVQLVNLKGGLRGMQSTHLAGLVQLIDLIDASRHLTKPMLAWDNLGAPLPKPIWPIITVPSSQSESIDAAKAFTTLPPEILSFHDLAATISVIVHTLTHLNEYFLNGQPMPAMVLLCESRNRAQHYALSLPSAFGTSTIDNQMIFQQLKESLSRSEQHLYEIIRLSLLIFNNLVIYPLPPFTGIDTRFARILKDEILNATTQHPDLKHRHVDVLLWALVLGGISDCHDLQRGWYLEEVREMLQTLPHLRRWANIERLLTSFLWFDFILNKEAIRFWIEASKTMNS